MPSPRLTRAQWGAAPVPAGRPTRIDSTRGTALHWYGGGLGAYAHDRCASILRGIQQTHMAGQWYDIAYNDAVCRHGTRYECRGYHVQTGANGHASANRSHYAVLAMVGAGDALPLAMVDALVDAFDAYRARGDAGDAVTGHRDHTATTRPGNALYAMVRAGRFSPHPPDPPKPPPIPLTEEWNEMLIRVTETAGNPVFVTDGTARRWLPTWQALQDYQSARKASNLPALPVVDVPTEPRALAAFGPIVGKGPTA